MNLTIKNSSCKTLPYFRVMDGETEFCTVKNHKNALLIIDAFKKFESDEKNNSSGLEKTLEKIKKNTGIDLKTDHQRKRNIANLRFIYCKIAKDLGYTLTETGKPINRDHASVSHALKKFNDFYQTEPKFRELYFQIKD